MEEVRRLQVRLEEQEERNKTLREVNAELRRQLQSHESAAGGVNEKAILNRGDGGTGKKVSQARRSKLSIAEGHRWSSLTRHFDCESRRKSLAFEAANYLIVKFPGISCF